jgi:hypothetical protein
MIRRTALVVMLLTLALPAYAADEDHAGGSHKTISFGRSRLVPSDLTMAASDVLVFENFTTRPATVRFLSPDNQVDKIRCEAVGKGKATGQLALFSWDYKKRLVATIAPGRFASLCSLAPGQYTYLVGPTLNVGAGTGVGHNLEMKGTITVQ